MKRLALFFLMFVFTINIFCMSDVSFASTYTEQQRIEREIANDPESTSNYEDLYDLLRGNYEGIIVFADGRRISVDTYGLDENKRSVFVKAEYIDGNLYIPARPLVEQLGGQIDFYSTLEEVEIRDLKYDLIEIKGCTSPTISYVYVNGSKMYLSTPIRFKYARIYVPIDFVDKYLVKYARCYGDSRLTIVQIIYKPICYKVAAPTMSPNGGTYNETQYVKIRCSDEDATIYYTTDGSNPDRYSRRYDGSIKVDRDMTIKAVAYKNGVYSDIVSEIYRINCENTVKPKKPVMFPAGGTYNCTQYVEIRCEDKDAVIYYKRDGDQYSQLYQSPLKVDRDMTIRAVSYKNGVYSDIVSETYKINYIIPDQPTASPRGGIYNTAQRVELRSTPGAEIYYTTDGSTPYSTSAKKYTEPILVDKNMTIKARAYMNGQSSGIMAEAYFINKEILELPVVSPSPGTYNSPQWITLSAPPGTIIRYTTDGSTPNEESSIYMYKIYVDRNMTIKARAYKDGNVSPVMVASFVITNDKPAPMQPFAAPGSGEYDNAIYVYLFADSDAEIYYTTDGSTPYSTCSKKYTEPILVNKTMKIKARAYRGDKRSSVMEATYVIKAAVTAPTKPTANPKGGTYGTAQRVELKSTPGAEIYYTTDGSTPYSTSSKKYTEPILVDRDMTIKARAYMNGQSSDIMEETYHINLPAAIEDDEESLLELAWAKYNSKKYDEAIQILNELLEKYEDSEEAIILLADCYIAKNDLRSAKGALSAFISEYEYPRVINKYAEVCILLGQYSEAKRVIIDVLPKFSDHIYLYRTLTYAYSRLGQKDIKVFIHGKEVEFEKYDNIKPIIVNGTTLVPIRAFAEAMNANVLWDSYTKKATISFNGKVIKLTEGSTQAEVNNKKVTLDVPARIYRERLLVPLRFISENFGKEVNWYEVEGARVISVTNYSL